MLKFLILLSILFSKPVFADSLNCKFGWGPMLGSIEGSINRSTKEADLTFLLNDEIHFKNGSVGVRIKNGKYKDYFSFKIGFRPAGGVSPAAHIYLLLPITFFILKEFDAIVYTENSDGTRNFNEAECERDENK